MLARFGLQPHSAAMVHVRLRSGGSMAKALCYGLQPNEVETFRHWTSAQANYWGEIKELGWVHGDMVDHRYELTLHPSTRLPKHRVAPAGCTVVHPETGCYYTADEASTFEENRDEAEAQLGALVGDVRLLEIKMESIRALPSKPAARPPTSSKAYFAELDALIQAVGGTETE
ncbi:MAG: hypothetical protein ACRBI6_04700 [Acidimicrobiales bacterium]